MKFKVGDKIRLLKDNFGHKNGGAICYVTEIKNGKINIIETDGTWGWQRDYDVPENYQSKSSDLYWYIGGEDNRFELVKSNNLISKIMNTKEKFLLAFKSEPEKSFRKAEITNGDDLLTETGTQIFLSWLLKKHGDEFKKEVVDKLLEDDK